jgi:hypothetical protein
MARTSNNTVFEAAELRLVMSPFRKVLVYVLTAIFLASVSIFTLFVFVDNLGATHLLQQYQRSDASKVHLTQTMVEQLYKFLHWIFFDLTQIKQSLSEPLIRNSPGYSIHLFIVRHYESWVKLDGVLRIISFRLATITSVFIMIASILYFLAVIDGGVRRSIRRDLIGRESAGLYHRMKYFNYVLLILGFELYLTLPFFTPEHTIILFIAMSAFLYSVQIKYYKKYL